MVRERERPTGIGAGDGLKTAGVGTPQADSAIHEAAE
jgi:hypothetical protein